VCDDGVIPNDPATVDAAGPALLASTLVVELGIPLEVNDGLVTVKSGNEALYRQVVARTRKKGF
jgi:hypothetical protein